jgi:hypothetical protein
MRINQVFVEMGGANDEMGVQQNALIIVVVCDNRNRTLIRITVDQLPHKKSSGYSEWIKITDKLSDNKKLWAIFSNKSPQKIRSMFPTGKLSYKKLRTLMREQSVDE